jgi:membrane-associated phospholipid phosphatase
MTARAAASQRDADAPGGDLSAWTDGLLLGGALLYGGFVGVLTIVRGVPLTADVVLVATALLAVMAVRQRFAVLRDWTPFLVLFLAYGLMRGLADDIGMPVHVGDMAQLERSLFGGQLPTALLQGWLHPATGTDWLAVAGTVLYYVHLAVPVLTAMLLWRARQALFHPYLIALILLSFAGFVTYLLLPVAPPWYAAAAGQIGTLAGEPAIEDLKLHAFTTVVGGIGLDGDSLYDVAFLALSANPVAAFPSLHAALAFLSFLVLRRAFGTAGWWAFAYVAAVTFTIVYTADHYVIDVIGGVAYASAAYLVMGALWRRVTPAEPALEPLVEPG